jgi:hypothetical protein
MMIREERGYAGLKKKKVERMVLLGPYSGCIPPRLKKWNGKADDKCSVAAAADPINLLFFFPFLFLTVPRLCVMAKRGQEVREIHALVVSPPSPSLSHTAQWRYDCDSSPRAPMASATKKKLISSISTFFFPRVFSINKYVGPSARD